MRGDPLHNLTVEKTETPLSRFFKEVYLEYKCSRNGVTTYFDCFARQNHFVLACEIETTARHGVDNAVKAAAVGVPLWIIVPTNNVKEQLQHKLKPLQLRPGGEPIKILLLGQLQEELEKYMSLKTLANLQTGIMAISDSKGENGL
jgi:hypothetical protein